MGHPDPHISALLQTMTSPAAYTRIVSPKSGVEFALWTAGLDYWKIIPRYKVSQCPICNRSITARMDTYSIVNAPHNGWFRRHFSVSPDQESTHCSHFVAVKHFLHLNGSLPSEAKYVELWSAEVPAIQAGLLPNDIETYAVLHALPVARIEENNFVPRYTLYLMAYYARNPADITQRWRENVTKADIQDPDYHGVWLLSPGEQENFDLTRWLMQGQLRWLDTAAAGLPLASQSSSQFPYAGISGRRVGVTFRDGVLRERLI